MKKKNHISSTYPTKGRVSARDNLVKYTIFYPMGLFVGKTMYISE